MANRKPGEANDDNLPKRFYKKINGKTVFIPRQQADSSTRYGSVPLVAKFGDDFVSKKEVKQWAKICADTPDLKEIEKIHDILNEEIHLRLSRAKSRQIALAQNHACKTKKKINPALWIREADKTLLLVLSQIFLRTTESNFTPTTTLPKRRITQREIDHLPPLFFVALF